MNRRIFAETVGGMLYAAGQLRRDMHPTFVTHNVTRNETRFHPLGEDALADLSSAGARIMQAHILNDDAHLVALVAHVGRLELPDVTEEEQRLLLNQLQAGLIDPDSVTQDAISILAQDAHGSSELSSPLDDGQQQPPPLSVLGAAEGWNFFDFEAEGWSTSLALNLPERPPDEDAASM